MKTSFTLIFLLFFKITFASDVIDEVSSAFKSGNSKEISKYFSSTVELAILDNEEIYSSNQAELILKDFLVKHPPLSIKIVHKVVSNPNYKFGVIILNSSKGVFRVSFELKNAGGSFNITQIRIEENKE
ncbi:DUF4783 domain-containing protein [Pedobacter cryophilus]|uniref:DUF4783 domain-containing protein n=1 Tax=Pedobacter cryophilus TaxID=2571271 RepID=A0A4U1BWD6_9SPHI|nr:DUF4783 domain-containing protein [Pedobacter cryophilus]TKB96802.1 DUF4783 domain-containing protein [Pedobacter cryophilus]